MKILKKYFCISRNIFLENGTKRYNVSNMMNNESLNESQDE